MSDVVRRRTNATISISREPIETRDFEMARATRAIDGTHCDAREPHDECPMIGLSRDGTRPTRAGGDGAATRRHTATDERASERTASEATRTRARNERTMARRAGDATGKKNDDGDARRGRCARGRRAPKRATIAAMGVMSACGVGANALTHISTLAGSYKLKTLNRDVGTSERRNAHTVLKAALDYGNSVAHIIAELRTFTSSADNWDKMDTNYDSMSKTWVEDAVICDDVQRVDLDFHPKVLRGINGVTAVANPLEAYIAEAVVIAKADGTSLEAMREIIEKTVWDAVGYQGSLLALAAAQEDEGAGCLCTSSSQTQTAAMKAHWDVGAALLIGDGYHSVLGRAQKRGLEFGTMGAAGISKPYETIVKLLRDGQEIEGATMCDDLHNIYEDIEAQMRVVYAQSILKYAYKIDKKLASGASVNAYDDVVAEGQAMYRVIAGDMLRKCATACSGAVGFFNTFFDITIPKQRGTWDYGNYCTARKHVVDFINTMSSHGVKEASLGTYSEAAYVNCALETNEDPARELKSLAGSYFTSELTHSSTAQATVSAKTQYAKALGLSKNVAHIVAEMDTFIRNEDVSASWDDMSTDFVEAYKAWTETAPYTSNEWNQRMTQYEFTKVAVGSSGKYAATGSAAFRLHRRGRDAREDA